MKQRTLRTYKILAVAFTAAAGCSPASNPNASATATPAQPEAAMVIAPEKADETPKDAEPQTSSPAPTAASGARTSEAAGSTASAPEARPLPKQFDDPKLNTLLSEVLQKPARDVFAHLPKYRPLCDKDGYPLVGNVARKGAPEVQPSTLCEEIRSRMPH